MVRHLIVWLVSSLGFDPKDLDFKVRLKGSRRHIKTGSALWNVIILLDCLCVVGFAIGIYAIAAVLL